MMNLLTGPPLFKASLVPNVTWGQAKAWPEGERWEGWEGWGN